MTTGTLPRLSRRVKHEAAQIIAAKLLRLHEGDRQDPAAWQRVAERLGCRTLLYHTPGGDKGEFGPANADGAGVIAVNTAYPTDVQACVWVHELAHRELHIWMPPQLSDAADVCYYSDDRRNVRHQIARMVEMMVIG